MADETWRERIEAAVARDKRSLRSISIAAGVSPGYLHGILRDGKEPTLDRFEKICKELGMSLSFALMGVNISPKTEELINAVEGNQEKQDALLAILSSRAQGA